MGRILLTVALAAVLAAAVGWYFELFTGKPDETPPLSSEQQMKLDLAKLGEPLFPPAPEEKIKPFHPVAHGVDPIVIPGSLEVIDKVDLPSEVAGRVLYIGDGVPEGVTQVAGIAPFMQKEYEQATVVQGGRPIIKFYRPLRKGMEIEQGQLVGELDFARGLNMFLEHRALLETAIAQREAAEETVKAAFKLLDMTIKSGTATYTKEIIEADITHKRSKAEAVKAQTDVEKETAELDNAKNLLAFHELRFRLPVAHAYIKQIYHDTGEAVKENEPVLHLYSIDRLMAEAFVEAQYASRLKANAIATIEPAEDSMPLRTFEGHRAPITGVGFVTSKQDAYLASTSEDGFLKLWHQKYKGAIAGVDHREPIRSMACSPAGAAKSRVVTGAADGKIYLWNLVAEDDQSLPRFTAVLQGPIDAHRDSVTALAFSPDGAYFASGGADGSIKLWRTEDGKLIYAFDAEHGADNPHQGSITALAFTPQSRLVSASRDNTLRVWELRQNGAHLAEGSPITGRSGNIHELGVSQDGRWMLFDQGKSLQLMTVPDGQAINTIKNPGGGAPFETLAVFSPDASLIMTGGAPEGRLQLWRAPSDANRGFEVRQFVTDQRSPVTCAAFAPAAVGQTAFAASGGKNGFVYLWPVPTKEEIDNHPIRNVPVRMFTKGIEAGSRQYRIGVEVPNPTGRLHPGRQATIVVE